MSGIKERLANQQPRTEPVVRETRDHTLVSQSLRSVISHATSALGTSDLTVATDFLSHARECAYRARQAAFTDAEKLAADYMVNFVADLGVAIRRSGLAADLSG